MLFSNRKAFKAVNVKENKDREGINFALHLHCIMIKKIVNTFYFNNGVTSSKIETGVFPGQLVYICELHYFCRLSETK